MLQIARDGPGSRADLRQGDAQAPEFPGATFDTVVCTFSLCAIPDDRKAVAEMATACAARAAARRSRRGLALARPRGAGPDRGDQRPSAGRAFPPPTGQAHAGLRFIIEGHDRVQAWRRRAAGRKPQA
jgi:hypothetical protein